MKRAYLVVGEVYVEARRVNGELMPGDEVRLIDKGKWAKASWARPMSERDRLPHPEYGTIPGPSGYRADTGRMVVVEPRVPVLSGATDRVEWTRRTKLVDPSRLLTVSEAKGVQEVLRQRHETVESHRRRRGQQVKELMVRLRALGIASDPRDLSLGDVRRLLDLAEGRQPEESGTAVAGYLCGARYGTGDGGAAVCVREADHPPVAVYRIGHSDAERLRGR